MVPRVLVFVVTLGCLLLHAPRAKAAPMSTSLDYWQAHATSVVIGTVHSRKGAKPDTFDTVVNVETSLRGKHKRGDVVVTTPSPDGMVTVEDGARVVVFLEGTAFRWVGQLVAGPSLEQGVIHLSGFFDFNAHLVDPGIVTLAQLKDLLAGGSPSYRFNVTLSFADARGVVTPSTKHFDVTWTPPGPKDRSRPPPRVSGVPMKCLQPSALFGVDWGSFELSFYDPCPHKTASSARRSLDLRGGYVGVDPVTGAIRVEVSPDRPFLSEAEFDAFVADAAVVDVTRIVNVTAKDGTTWTWLVGKALVDATGRELSAGGMSIRTESNGTTTRSFHELSFGDVTLTLEPGPDLGSPGGHPSGISVAVAGGRSKCSISWPGHASMPCALENAPPKIVRSP